MATRKKSNGGRGAAANERYDIHGEQHKVVTCDAAEDTDPPLLRLTVCTNQKNEYGGRTLQTITKEKDGDTYRITHILEVKRDKSGQGKEKSKHQIDEHTGVHSLPIY